jgi:mono/diheme cytochrome c family protein
MTHSPPFGAYYLLAGFDDPPETTLVKRFLKWTAIGLGSLIAVAILVIYGLSEYQLRRKYDVAAVPIMVPTDSASIERGKHIALTRGCAGCHGQNLEGKVMFDDPKIARIVAPNITKIVREYSDAELARAIRHGVRRNGTSVAVMPSSMFYHLSDADLGALVAYLRTVPPTESALPGHSMRILARVGIVTGQYHTEASTINHKARRSPEPSDADVVERGRYLAKSSCTECHGQNFEGGNAGPAPTPSLVVVQAYSAEEFTRLMRQGVPRDGRKLGFMGDVARSRFSQYTDAEVAALYAYLHRPNDATTAAR